MGQINGVEVSYGGVFNLGTYQRAHIHATLDARDDPDYIACELYGQARGMV